MGKAQPNYYSILTADIRYDKRLKHHADCKVLYSEITALANRQGYCHAKNSYFAELYDRPKETISKWINLLKDCGYLKIKMIYKEGTKQIIERRLYPVSTPINAGEDIDANVNTPVNADDNTYTRERKEGINADIKDNITSINNTSMNIDDDARAREEKNQPEEEPFNVAAKMGINVNSGFHMPIFVEFIQTLSSPVVCWALHKTDDGAEHPNWTYLLTILKDLEANSVRTVEQAERYAKEYDRKKKSKGQSRSNYRNRQPIKEPMPAWWDKQQKEETKPQQYTEKIDDSGDPMPDD